jgi:tricorn protease
VEPYYVLVTSDHGKLTVIPAERKTHGDNPDDKIEVDRSRARFLLDPPAMWRQAYAEAGRIMRHDFWMRDMADVDWVAGRVAGARCRAPAP